MSTPLRRTTRHIDLGLVRAANELAELAPRAEGAWNNLRIELHAQGWPARTPEGDQKPRATTCPHGDNDCTCRAIDYTDPTGEQAINAMHDSRNEFENIRHELRALAKRLEHLARKHEIPATHIDPESHRTTGTRPCCTVPGCNTEVESRKLTGGGYSYVGMVKRGAQWYANPDAKPPVCTKHRKQRERSAA